MKLLSSGVVMFNICDGAISICYGEIVAKSPVLLPCPVVESGGALLV